MAKEPEERLLTSEERTTNTLFDKNGNMVISSEHIKQEYEDPDGPDYTTLNSEHFEASDGTFLSTALISLPEARGGVPVKRCDVCEDETKTFSSWLFRRNRKIITFAPAKTVKQCASASCRRNCCSRHYTISKDRRIRCKACDRKFRRNQRIFKTLRFIFMRKI